MTLLQHALDWAARGVAVFPCQLPKKDPLTKNGFKDGSTDPDVIRRWWRRWPNAIIGAEVPKGIVIIDVDVKGGLDKKSGMPVINGADTWAALIAAHGEPHTFTVRTGGGGLHLWFKTTGWTHETNARGLFKDRGVDVRGHTTGYVILPPSGHELGTFYEVIDDREPAEMPDWIRTIITTEPKDTPPRPKPRDPGAPQGEVARAVERWNSDHPIAFERATRHRCPVCDDKGSFGPLKGDTSRWSCFSTDHPDDVGLQSNECFTGDALDLACHDRRLSRVDLLRQDGYLEDRPAPRRQAPDAPPPWLTDAPIPDDPGIWDSPDQDFAPATEQEHPEEIAYRVDTSGQAYVLRLGSWRPYPKDSLWQWCYEQNHMLDAKDRAKAASLQAKTVPLAFSIDMHCHSAEPVVTIDGVPHLNIFRGIAKPGDTGTSADWPIIGQHLDFMFAEHSEEWEWMLDWMAMWYQPLASLRGHKRTECMPLLYGTQGSGKGLFFRLLKRIVTERHFVKVKGTSLDDKFSPASIDHALIYVIDEMNNPEATDWLKIIIGDDNASVRRMYQAETNFIPKCNVIASSNLDRPVRTEYGDRRYCYMHLNRAMPLDLAQRIVEHEQQGYPELPAFLHWLMQRQVQRAGNVMKPIDNAARRQQIELSLDPHVRFVRHIQNGDLHDLLYAYRESKGATMAPRHKTWCHKIDQNGLAAVQSTLLTAAYTHWCNQQGYRRATNVDFMLAHLADTIPTVRYRDPNGASGIQVYNNGANIRCVTGLPTGGRSLTYQPSDHEPDDTTKTAANRQLPC